MVLYPALSCRIEVQQSGVALVHIGRESRFPDSTRRPGKNGIFFNRLRAEKRVPYNSGNFSHKLHGLKKWLKNFNKRKELKALKIHVYIWAVCIQAKE